MLLHYRDGNENHWIETRGVISFYNVFDKSRGRRVLKVFYSSGISVTVNDPDGELGVELAGVIGVARSLEWEPEPDNNE